MSLWAFGVPREFERKRTKKQPKSRLVIQKRSTAVSDKKVPTITREGISNDELFDNAKEAGLDLPTIIAMGIDLEKLKNELVVHAITEQPKNQMQILAYFTLRWFDKA